MISAGYKSDHKLTVFITPSRKSPDNDIHGANDVGHVNFAFWVNLCYEAFRLYQYQVMKKYYADVYTLRTGEMIITQIIG